MFDVRCSIFLSSFILGLSIIAAGTIASLAQPAQSKPLDPLLQLMISQPSIEIATNIEVQATFDPPVIRLGQESTYRITFDALDDSIQLPDKIAAPPELELQLSARGQAFLPAVGRLQPKTGVNHHVRASAIGSYVIPEFDVQVYDRRVVVPAARLEVVPASAIDPAPLARLQLELTATNVYLGQRISLRVVMHSSMSNTVEALAYPRVNGDGFLVDQSAAHQNIGATSINGQLISAYSYETALTPLVTGTLSVSAQGFTAGNQFSGPIIIQGKVVIPGGPPQYLLVDSDTVMLNVRALPRSGELPGFTGAIGTFTRNPPVLSTNRARVGDLVKLVVTFGSQEDLGRFVAPPPPDQAQWQMFDAVPGGVPVRPGGVNPPPGSTATFTYSMIPLSDGVTTTPSIPFSCFDPERGSYVDLTIPPMPIKVAPGPTNADAQPWIEAGRSLAKDEHKLSLSDLAASPGPAVDTLVPLQQRGWFVVVQLLPLVGFAGLWRWDRRRRFLEQHPDIVLRRKARRALRRARRALEAAFRDGDPLQFTRLGTDALRVACAPHYPAEPRALVCGDVLALLPEAERLDGTREAIQRLFAAADASQFSGATTDGRGLLELQPELERVLGRLEEKL